ncbi:hypothetical protein BpHYR1_054276 [Brachionus plicatilis]|uniref:Uncharacterized protein n=1 Tax=Brachionus plicatilis TaxID=10195 RepID=A0A3M7P443_BRAPC|nr:hypothetical protein BpHYR1_054276 [Brachionus plicatilis]
MPTTRHIRSVRTKPLRKYLLANLCRGDRTRYSFLTSLRITDILVSFAWSRALKCAMMYVIVTIRIEINESDERPMVSQVSISYKVMSKGCHDLEEFMDGVVYD